MSTDEAIRVLRSNSDLLGEFSVKALYLFGSAVRGEDRPDSDFDILVEFDSAAHVGLFAFCRLQRLLSKLLGRPVDLATPDALHKALKERIMAEAIRAA